MKLVDDLSIIWKRWSVQITAAQVVILATYGAMKAVDIAPDVPGWLGWLVLFVLSAAALTVAPLQQKNLPPA